MATTAHVLARYQPATRLLPSTLDRYARDLRSRALIPISGKGGGVRAKHWWRSDLTNLLLGLSGPAPSDAAEACRLLRPLRHAGIKGDRERMMGVWPSLGETLDGLVGGLESPEKRLDATTRLQGSDWRLTLCLDPVSAWMSGVDGEGRYMIFFGNSEYESWGKSPEYFCRKTEYSIRMFGVAGELLEDSRLHSRDAAIAPSEDQRTGGR